MRKVPRKPRKCSSKLRRTTGYPVRLGHSTGYQGYLGGQIYPQIPSGWDDAFCDERFEFSNNHGRLFGPHWASGAYVLVGAFSRENVSPFHWPGHRYNSFNKARDDFARKLSNTPRYELVGFVHLDNAIVGDTYDTTGDHDGNAALLRVRR
jgi:hypothetical protein